MTTTQRSTAFPSYDAFCRVCGAVTPHRDGWCQDPEHAAGFPQPAFDPAQQREGKDR